MGIEDLFEEGFSPPPEIPFWAFTHKGKEERVREPLSVARRTIWPYVVSIEKNKSGYTIKVEDESGGYSKVVAKTTGQDIYDAKRKFERACDIARGKE